MANAARIVSVVQLTDQDLQEFCEIWKQVFNEDLSLGDARDCASQLLELYAMLAKTLPSERRPPDSTL